MSQTFSVSRSSTSSDDGDHDYRRQYFSSQTSDGSSIPPVIAAAPAPDVSVAPSSSITSPEQRPLRLLDVSNILNPTPQGSIDSSRRTSLAHFGSPRSSAHAGAARHGGPRSLPQSPVVLSNPVDPTLRTGGGEGGSGTFPGRRIAPAVPPPSRVRHATSRPSLSGMMGVQDNPFQHGTPRRGTGYGSEMHTTPGRPPPPTHPPVAGPSSQASFPFPPPPPVPTTPLQYAASFSTPMPSANASPNTSYSSYVQAQSPVPTTPTFNHPGYISGHLNVGGGSGGGGGGGGGPQGSGSSYSISGPSSHGGYQMMALNTSEGAIHIPVNTTAASRSADEKRKRNAGASARFRQRRKEREREMSTRISDLEQRLKKVEDERDYYRDLALRSQQQQQQQQQQQRPGRPPLVSPRGIGPGEGSGSGGGGGAFSGFGSRSGELPRPGSTTSASMRELPGIEGGGFPGRSAPHSGMSASRSGGDMRESSSGSSAAAIRRNAERERERYEREREREREQRHPGGDERRHH